MNADKRRLLVGVFACAMGVLAASPRIEKTVLFEKGKGEYAHYRIPGVVVTKKGTIVVYCEARKSTRGDWSATDILLRRSTDGGKTFSEPVMIGRMVESFVKNPVAQEKKLGAGEGSGTTYNNPTAIADKDGTVHFLFCVEYMRAFYMRSTDDGKTFSKPVEITSAFDSLQKVFPWRILAIGPGHGIQLKNGRLLAPVWIAKGTGNSGHGDSVTATLYSDDRGATWHTGDVAAPDTPEMPSPNETVAAQLSDGRVMLNVRAPSKTQKRIVVYSKDGATGWSKPAFDEGLFEPVCFASLVRAGKHRLVFSNPDSEKRLRKNLTVRVSDDDGKTWRTKRVLEPGPSAYSDLAAGAHDEILCFYEAGTKTSYDSLVLARFNLDWLKENVSTH